MPDPDPKTSEDSRAAAEHEPPTGSTTEHVLRLPAGETLEYTARAGWTVLREKDKPVAEMFSVAYTVDTEDPGRRPVTFVFNGGPGAASAYLHVGALGPQRIVFDDGGTPLPPPTSLVDNAESWLPFTDLVFIDPIGTGFSRLIDKEGEKSPSNGASSGEKKPDANRFFGLNKDLQSLGEFMRRYLSTHHRWLSPVFIAGESYGGFRVAKLAKLLQQGFGIGVNGAILISPALEIALLDPSDYDVLPWVDKFPTMALAAAHHGKATAFEAGAGIEACRTQAEAFATSRYAQMLVQGRSASADERISAFAETAAFLGLSPTLVQRNEGRVGMATFARELLRDKRRTLGLYDSTVSIDDPFPDRETFEGPDPTLYGIERIFAAGINAWLRGSLGITTDREYHLLSMEVNEAWKIDAKRHALESKLGATDDLRYGMSINPHMKVRITHGLHDLVTPYFSSDRICHQMKLSPDLAANLSLQHYSGGHMFYAWKASREAFHADIEAFYRSALEG